jgi:hypothetical protein
MTARQVAASRVATAQSGAYHEYGTSSERDQEEFHWRYWSEGGLADVIRRDAMAKLR